MEYRKAAPAMAEAQRRHELGLEAIKGEARNAGKPQQGVAQAQKNLFAAHMAGSGDRPPNSYAYNAAVTAFNMLSGLGFDPLTSEAQAHQYAARLDDASLLAQIMRRSPKLSDAEAQAELIDERADELQLIQRELQEMMRPARQAAG